MMSRASLIVILIIWAAAVRAVLVGSPAMSLFFFTILNERA